MPASEGLGERLNEEIRARVLGADFVKLVQSVRRGGSSFRISLRPVEIGGERKFQAEMNDGGCVQVKNFDANGAAAGLEKILAQRGARDLHLLTAHEDLHVRVTKKGRVLESRAAAERSAELRPHDRVKNVPLASFDSAAFLRVIGLADGEGNVRASQRGKYDQVNEFLKIVGETLAEAPRDRPFTLVDCGCGKAYLALAAYFYLTRSLGFSSVTVVGVDRRADVVAAARKTAEALDAAADARFVEADLAAFDLASAFPAGHGTGVDMVVSLHACDTATDEALARAVEWNARWILSAPCCQHELQKSVTPASGNGAFAALLRQGILRERLCDLLTDAFRAALLRVLGYKTSVVEFVSSDATARNVLIRAEGGAKSGRPGPVGEYLALRDFWRVTPWLETRLAPMLAKYFLRHGERS